MDCVLGEKYRRLFWTDGAWGPMLTPVQDEWLWRMGSHHGKMPGPVLLSG